MQSTKAAPKRAGAEIALAECSRLARQLRSPQAMFNLGTVLLNAGDSQGAEGWYREALGHDPAMVEANHNLASILEDTGRIEEARVHRDLALRRRCLHIETALPSRVSVLVLCAGAYGNTPIEHLLPRATTTRLKLFVEYATAADWAALPPVDRVFNAIGDADLAPDAEALRPYLAGRRVLNHPDQVARTRRDLLPGLLAGLDCVVPEVLRLAAGEAVAGRIGGPVLVRPLGAHGGSGVARATNPPARGHPAYATAYHDYRSADGLYRKYRMIFVAGAAYPYHLAISSHWLVHYFSAEMRDTAWKLAEERRFLMAPAAVLGEGAMATIAAIGRRLGEGAMATIAATGTRLGLDYGGVDFSLLPDGRVLVFEANATMLVYPDEDYRRAPVATILTAFADMLEARK